LEEQRRDADRREERRQKEQRFQQLIAAMMNREF
jgi:hypothetical protein